MENFILSVLFSAFFIVVLVLIAQLIDISRDIKENEKNLILHKEEGKRLQHLITVNLMQQAALVDRLIVLEMMMRGTY